MYSFYVPLCMANLLETVHVTSRLDYCNSLIYNIVLKDVAQLHHVNHCLTTTVTTEYPRFPPAMLLIKSLHWLPVRYRNIY